MTVRAKIGRKFSLARVSMNADLFLSLNIAASHAIFQVVKNLHWMIDLFDRQVNDFLTTSTASLRK